MSAIGQVDSGVNANYSTEGTKKTGRTAAQDYGNTIGQPQLSEKASKYYEQLKAKVKISVLEEKKSLFGKTKTGYRTKVVHLNELAGWNLARKKKMGIVIQELIISKLALMTFSV